MSSGARLALFGLIGVLLVILAVLIVFALVIRRRSSSERKLADTSEVEEEEALVEAIPEGRVLLSSAAVAADAGAAALGAVSGSVAIDKPEIMACPTCRRQYETKLQYCPYDARRLVPASEVLEGARKNGGICPRCHRAFDPGMRYCPHDGTELIPSPLYRVTKGRKPTAKPTGVVGKICPRCNARHDLSETFCGKDGSELVIIN
jgi:hypothetical protein